MADEKELLGRQR